MSYAALFPGQGSQSLGMLSSYDDKIIRKTFTEASAVVGKDLWKLAQGEDADALNQTVVTQPLMLTADIALWRLWMSRASDAPSSVSGHSLGEWAALVAAQVLDFESALSLVIKRATLMQNAVPEGQGGMVAVVGLDDHAIRELCSDFPRTNESSVLEPANFNAPGQVVVAGTQDGLDWLVANAKEKGARMAKKLAMSVPSHCSLLRAAADELHTAMLKVKFKSPRIPVIHNADASRHSDADEIRTALRDQLYQPVRWVECVKKMIESEQENAVEDLLECGPGKVLTGLAKRTFPDIPCYSLENADGMKSTLGVLGEKSV